MSFLEKTEWAMQHNRPFTGRLSFSFHVDGILPKMLKWFNFSGTMMSPPNSLAFTSEIGRRSSNTVQAKSQKEK